MYESEKAMIEEWRIRGGLLQELDSLRSRVAELEAEGLKNTLLPLQRKLSNDLDKALSSPMLQSITDPGSKLNCSN